MSPLDYYAQCMEQWNMFQTTNQRTEVSSNMASALVLIHFERWDFHKKAI